MNKIIQDIRKHQGMVLITLILVLTLVLPLFNCSVEEPPSFIVVVDQRYKASEPYHSKEHFLGALLAIKEVGKGMFMLNPGDIDPPWASKELIAEVLGEDYLWYPAVGNHELPEEDPQYLEYLRELNQGGQSLPHIVRKGPPGCEETTYSFEIGDCHVAVLNMYYDGKSDHGIDGKIVPQLLAWLENDLKNTDKPYVFVAGHEPLVAMPDMDNGRIRHQGDSLDKYPFSSYRFHQLMVKYGVTAYFTGHTHGASVAKINGLWQIDGGHARGMERQTPTYLFEDLSEYIEKHESPGKPEEELLEEYFYAVDTYDIKKTLFYTDLTGGIDYHDLSDETALKHFIEFHQNYKNDPQLRASYIHTFDQRSDQTRSSFLKVTLEQPSVKIDIYRDDARGGTYHLMHTFYLN